jgi:hypothetical protein
LVSRPTSEAIWSPARGTRRFTSMRRAFARCV